MAMAGDIDVGLGVCQERFDHLRTILWLLEHAVDDAREHHMQGRAQSLA